MKIELLACLIVFQFSCKLVATQMTNTEMDLNMMNLGRNKNGKFLDMSLFDFQNYDKHPCIRNCSEATPMVCKYYFSVEWFQTLSKACYDCPNNITDCSRTQCIVANGVERVVMVVNRQLPGPLIQVCLHDTIDVVLMNNLRMGETATIHWHGLYHKDSIWMDGVGMITQCPINPMTTFEYNFQVDQIGTYFWHPHVGVQRGDGFFGPLVIKSAQDPSLSEYDYDLNEHIMVLNDWFDTTVSQKFTYYVHSDTTGSMPTSILINGKGFSKNANFTAPKAVFHIKFGKRYRFRIIDASVGYCPLQVSIENHDLTLIATDGNPIQPIKVKSIVLNAAERYDFVLTANQRPGNYWIKVKGLGDCEMHEVFETAILNYKRMAVKSPKSSIDYYTSAPDDELSVNNIDEYPEENAKMVQDLRSIPSYNHPHDFYERIKQKPDKVFYFGMDLKTIDNPEYNNPMFNPINAMPGEKQFYTPQFNKISFSMPPYNLLSQYDQVPEEMFCNDLNYVKACPQNITEYYCTCIHMIEADLNDLVEIVLVDENYTIMDLDSPVVHPVHLHGYAFAVVSQARPPGDISSVEIVKQLNEEGKIVKNFDNPPFKDSVSTIDGGYTVIRLVADNPGIWMAHCHLDFHHYTGMAFLLKVGNLKDIPPKPRNWPECGSYFYKN